MLKFPGAIVKEIDKESLITVLTDQLPVLRAMIELSQEDISAIIGVSRQTYSAIETKKRRMTWNTFLLLILFFDKNEQTCGFLKHIGAFPDSLKHILNINQRDKSDDQWACEGYCIKP